MAKSGLVADEMVGRQYEQDGFRPVAVGDMQRGGGDGRRGVAAEGLEQVAEWRQALRQIKFVPGEEIVVAIGDRQNFAHFRQSHRAQQRLEQQAFAVRQLDEGLGQCLARHRPQAGAGTAGEDDGNECAHGEDFRIAELARLVGAIFRQDRLGQQLTRGILGREDRVLPAAASRWRVADRPSGCSARVRAPSNRWSCRETRRIRSARGSHGRSLAGSTVASCFRQREYRRPIGRRSGEPLRISTATSKTSPATTRTSLPCGCLIW